MADPFELLGLPRTFALDPKVLEKRWRELSKAVHPDRFANAAPADRRVAIERASAINEAQRALKNPQTRANALLTLAGRPITEQAKAPPEVLLEVMELREALEETREVPEAQRAGAIETLRSRVRQAVSDEETTLAECFGAEALPAGETLERAWAAALKLRYYYRFLEEAERLGEEE